MSDQKPLISLIIPAYNRAFVISETLQSVLHQSYDHWECLVVDDGSDDNTEEVVQTFIKADSRISYHKRPTHKSKGANACRNYGFEQSKGDYINWLDSDDLLDENHFSKHISWHQQGDILASVSVVDTFQKSVQVKMGLWANPFPEDDVIDDMCIGKVSWQTASVVWHRSALPQVPFNEQLQSSQEWTFHMEQMIKKIPHTVFKDTTVYVRRHSERTGKDFSPKKYRSMFLSRFLIYKKLYSSKELSVLREQGLIKRMAQASKGAARAKFISTVAGHYRKWFSLLFTSRHKGKIIGILLLGIPLYLIVGKGEKFFKI